MGEIFTRLFLSFIHLGGNKWDSRGKEITGKTGEHDMDEVGKAGRYLSRSKAAFISLVIWMTPQPAAVAARQNSTA